ncbi:protein of unknown function [Serratia sp. Tan611]|nr:protein of unknown function [Serratia sp. Tan611]
MGIGSLLSPLFIPESWARSVVIILFDRKWSDEINLAAVLPLGNLHCAECDSRHESWIANSVSVSSFALFIPNHHERSPMPAVGSQTRRSAG